jgi:hypothetical protein
MLVPGLIVGCIVPTMQAQLRSAVRWLGCVLAGLVLCGGELAQGQAQDLQPGQKIDPALLDWPRVFATNGYEFAVYQPQISKWQGNQLEGRFATAARSAGTSNETYGVVSFTARTEVDKVNRLVTLEDFKVTQVNFPMDKAMQKEFLAVEPPLQAATAKVIPLDHLEAVYAASADIGKDRAEPVKNDPPRVIYTTKPSVLVLVDGPPILKPLTGDYQRVVNTRAVLLQNTNTLNQGNYLYAGGRWYKAPALEGPWAANPNLQPGLEAALMAAQATKEVDLLLPKDTNAPPPNLQVYVSTVPAELLETTGAASMQSVADTELLYVSNTSNALFYCLNDASYYALLSGRWFKGKSLSGPWAFVPPGQLPDDFAKIPSDHEKSNVLASVPGTPQAQEAVVANSIPQTATIVRDKAKLEVDYAGAPGFAPVEGTPLQYATNTATPVVMVNPTAYYACQGGVWFVSPSPNGPWAVATSVPSSIYSIPVSSPIHYVTYSYVYGATPEYVYVGYTPGYMGTVVAPGDVVVYGTGYYYPPVVVGTTYVSYPPTYGYGWGMALGLSVGFAFGYCAGWSSGCYYQPNWGCYHWSSSYGYGYAHVNCNSTSYYSHWGTAVHPTGSYGYNAYTGTGWHNQRAATFNPYTGTRGAGARGGAFNPYSGNYAAGRQGAFYNPYSGARGAARSGTAGNANTGNYAAGRQAAGSNPSTGRYGATGRGVQGNTATGTASGYNRGVVGNANTGNKAAWNNGNVYAGKDGSVYKYNPSAGVQKYDSGNWQTVSRSTTPRSSQPATTRPATSTPRASSWSGTTPSASTTRPATAAQSTSAPRAASTPTDWANHASSGRSASANTATAPSARPYAGNQSSAAQYSGSSRAPSGQSTWANSSRPAQSAAGYKGAQAQMTPPSRAPSGQSTWANSSRPVQSAAGYKGAQAQMAPPSRPSSPAYSGGRSWGGSSAARSSSPVSSVPRESSAQALGSQRFNSWQSSGGGGWGGGSRSVGSGRSGGGGRR